MVVATVITDIGKNAFASFVHNHAEHLVLRNTLENLQENAVSGLARKIDILNDDFREFKGEMTEFKAEMKEFKTEITAEMKEFKAEVRAKFDSWDPTMLALRKFLSAQKY
jgi:peptidoglycan hydrolase CwlO-like protein